MHDQKRKILTRLENRRTYERVRQQRLRDQLKQRMSNNELTEKDLILIKKEKKRSQRKYQDKKAKSNVTNGENPIPNKKL